MIPGDIAAVADELRAEIATLEEEAAALERDLQDRDAELDALDVAASRNRLGVERMQVALELADYHNRLREARVALLRPRRARAA